jgi:uncharacterized protein YuzE
MAAIERFLWTLHAEQRLRERGLTRGEVEQAIAILRAMSTRYAYYDRDADIAWLPTGESEDVLSEETSWGLIDHDATTDEVVALEIWTASKRLPQAVLDALPAPGAASHSAAA